MIYPYKLGAWLRWDLIRAHLCTAAVAAGLQVTWRSPRDAFRYGGVQYGLAVTVAMLTVTLPLALLQLAVGQLSQQDAVGVWRAVPFFRGVGYLRLLISFFTATYSVIYLSLTITYFLYTISNSLPFWECIDLFTTDVDNLHSLNASACLNETFMSPVSEKPEYYLNVALILLVIWIVCPFIFYNPVKLMKRVFYVLGPLVIILVVVTASCIGNSGNLSTIVKRSDWRSFVDPNIWHGGIVQALLSTQTAGGYLISAGDTVYADTNVQWTAIAFVGANIVSTWIGLLFWYSISSASKDTSVFAVLIQTYKMGVESNTTVAWPIVIFFILIVSGFITLLTFLFPIYDHCRHIGGMRWRLLSMAGSLAGAGISMATLALRVPALTLLDDYAVPLLVSLTTIIEILPFVFIYGWKVLVEDVAFLTGRDLARRWVMGWCAAPGIIAPFTVWWVTMIYLREDDWLQPPYPAITIIVSTTLAIIVFLVMSLIVVTRQMQYDCPGKLKSSFKPSRHWGPRDPVTHYYWLSRREELERGPPVQTRYHRRQLGQLSGRPSFLIQTNSVPGNCGTSVVDKKRSNSDDWPYIVVRRQQKITKGDITKTRRRSKSLDWRPPHNEAPRKTFLSISELVALREKNKNNLVSAKNKIDN